MLITDRDLVLAAAATYGSAAATFVGLEGTARVFRTEVNDIAIYAIEGTHDNRGWALDALALPLPSQLVGGTPDQILNALHFMASPEVVHATVEHPDIGFVHGGIYAVLASVWDPMLTAIRADVSAGTPVALTGHSLGAGCAVLATAQASCTRRRRAAWAACGSAARRPVLGTAWERRGNGRRCPRTRAHGARSKERCPWPAAEGCRVVLPALPTADGSNASCTPFDGNGHPASRGAGPQVPAAHRMCYIFRISSAAFAARACAFVNR